MNTPENPALLKEGQKRSEAEFWPGRGVYLFPGQAVQGIGIGQELFNTSKAARAVFELATKMSGVDLAELCFRDPQNKLDNTLYIQLATGVVSIAAYRVLMEKYPQLRTIRPIGGAGVSFGEVTNTIVSRAVSDPESAVQLILKRGNIMEEVGNANPGRMAVVSKLPYEEVVEVCNDTGVYPALRYHNYVTVSGLDKQMDDAVRLAYERGGRITDKVMKYPLHTPHMHDAVPLFEDVLKKIDFQDPVYPVVLNHNAQITLSGEYIKNQLAWGLTNCVDVVKIVDVLKEKGGKFFVEFGPKPILGPLLARADKAIHATSVYDSHSVSDLNLNFS